MGKLWKHIISSYDPIGDFPLPCLITIPKGKVEIMPWRFVQKNVIQKRTSKQRHGPGDTRWMHYTHLLKSSECRAILTLFGNPTWQRMIPL